MVQESRNEARRSARWRAAAGPLCAFEMFTSAEHLSVGDDPNTFEFGKPWLI